MHTLLLKNNLDVQDYSCIYFANSACQRKKELTIYTLTECVAEWILVSEKHSECAIEQNLGEPLTDKRTVLSLPSTNVNSSCSLFSSFRFDFTLLQSSVKHCFWYFASVAVMSPSLRLTSSLESCKYFAQSLTCLRKFFDKQERRVLLSSSQKKQ